MTIRRQFKLPRDLCELAPKDMRLRIGFSLIKWARDGDGPDYGAALGCDVVRSCWNANFPVSANGTGQPTKIRTYMNPIPEERGSGQ